MNPRRVVPAAVGLVALAVYLRTLCPTVYVGDAGELATVAWSWGIAHPPGYPLWALLGHAATRLVPGEPALATNLLSAVCGAAGVALLSAALLRLGTGAVVASGAALGVAFAAGPWSQAVITEVYALNLLLGATLLLAFARAITGDRRAVSAAAFALGLGLANHPLVALAATPFLLLGRQLFSEWRSSVPLLLAGLAIYFLVPLRAGFDPVMEWGPLEGMASTLDHVFRAQYAADPNGSSLATRLGVAFEVWRADVPLPVLALALTGPWLAHRRRAALGFALVLVASGPLLVAGLTFTDSFRDRTVILPFLVTATVAAWMLAALGLEGLAARLPGRRTAVIAGLALLALAGLQLARHFDRCDRSGATLARDYASSVLDALPPGARIHAIGDNALFSLAYVHHALGRRPDVELVDRSLNLFVAQYGEDFEGMDRARRRALRTEREVAHALSRPEQPLFYSSRIPVDDFPGWRLVPTGLVLQLLRPGEERIAMEAALPDASPADPHDALETLFAAALHYRAGRSLLRDGHPEAARRRLDRASELGARSANLQLLVSEAWQEAGAPERARVCLERAVALEPENPTALYALALLSRGEESRTWLARLVDTGEADLTALVLHAVELAKSGRLEEAGRIVERALRIDPDSAPALELRAVLQRDADAPGQIVAEITALQARWMNELGRTQLERGQFAQASATFAWARDLAPDDAGSLRLQGYALLQARRLDEAADAFRQFLRRRPGDPAGLNALAYVFAITGDSLDSAAEMARRSAESSPALRPYALDTLGWIAWRAGRVEEALVRLREAEALLSGDPDMLAENAWHQAAVLHALGRDEEAREAASRARAGATDQFWIADLSQLERTLGN